MATKLGMCIHPNTVLDEFKGIIDLTPFRGHFGLKLREKLAILPVYCIYLSRHLTLYTASHLLSYQIKNNTKGVDKLVAGGGY